VVAASHAELGERYLYCDQGAPLLFTENETNAERVFGKPNGSPWVKDAINEYLVHGRIDAVNPVQTGTKVAAHYRVTVEAGQSIAMLKRRSSKGMNPRMAGIMGVFQIAWIYYGLLIASRPVIAWNMIAVVINLLSVAAYLRFARRERNPA
jgi:uncharacterized protein with PQ loop repeat